MPRNWEFYNIFGNEPVMGAEGGGAPGEDEYSLFEDQRAAWYARMKNMTG